MIDITGPKVLVPSVLFALLSPGLIFRLGGSDKGSGLLCHALILSVLSWVIIRFFFKFTVTTADLITPALVFVLLAPGILFKLPVDNLPLQVGFHAILFSMVYASIRGLFPQFY